LTRTCSICGSVRNIVRHHVSYEPEKTVFLCSGCHRKVHAGKLTLDGLELAKEDKRLTEHWDRMAYFYMVAHPMVLNADGDVITCDGKHFYENIARKRMSWNPCEKCSHRARCPEWEGIQIWQK